MMVIGSKTERITKRFAKWNSNIIKTAKPLKKSTDLSLGIFKLGGITLVFFCNLFHLIISYQFDKKIRLLNLT